MTLENVHTDMRISGSCALSGQPLISGADALLLCYLWENGEARLSFEDWSVKLGIVMPEIYDERSADKYTDIPGGMGRLAAARAREEAAKAARVLLVDVAKRLESAGIVKAETVIYVTDGGVLRKASGEEAKSIALINARVKAEFERKHMFALMTNRFAKKQYEEAVSALMETELGISSAQELFAIAPLNMSAAESYRGIDLSELLRALRAEMKNELKHRITSSCKNSFDRLTAEEMCFFIDKLM